MKNIFKKFVFTFLVIALFFVNNVYAEELPEIITIEPITIHLEIIAGENSLYDSDISVNACDSDNNQDTPDTITAYCAILQSGLSSDWNWSWAPGAFVNSIGDVAGYTSQDQDGNDVYHYWSWSLNGNLGEVGLNQYNLQPNDIISLTFIDPVVEVIDPIVEIIEEEVISNHHSGGSSRKSKKEFSLDKLSLFLSENQKDDGSFGELIYSDWVAIGIAKSGNEFNIIKDKLFNYIKYNNVESKVVTDNERRAMALMSMGVNPYSGTQINYIKEIISSFDGNQIGDISLYNDDIFGLLILSKVGYVKEDEIIQKIVSQILLNQSSDGSWGSVDMTSASIQALRNIESIDGVAESIAKAELYLKEIQKKNGSFGDNIFSTSWAVQALIPNDSFSLEVNKAIKYIKEAQQKDGGIAENSDINNRIWATSYAIPAVLKLSWNDILLPFPKEEIKLEISKSENDVNNKMKIADKKVEVKVIKKDDFEKEITQLNKNVLSASVINYDKKESQENASLFNKTLKKIVYPFVWVYSLF